MTVTHLFFPFFYVSMFPSFISVTWLSPPYVISFITLCIFSLHLCHIFFDSVTHLLKPVSCLWCSYSSMFFQRVQTQWWYQLHLMMIFVHIFQFRTNRWVLPLIFLTQVCLFPTIKLRPIVCFVCYWYLFVLVSIKIMGRHLLWSQWFKQAFHEGRGGVGGS